MQWYYQAAGKAIGPLSPDDLRMLAGQGVVRAQTLVRREADSQWSQAGHVMGLLDAEKALPPPILATVAPTENHIPEMPITVRPPSLNGVGGQAGKSDRESNFPVVITAVVCGFVLSVAVVVVYYHVYVRDTWAEDMRHEIPRRVDEAAAMPPMQSVSAYEKILTEAE
ncbi:MAG: DUF4339 domain-containing protein, partial [Thermoguttaceae bacterium]